VRATTSERDGKVVKQQYYIRPGTSDGVLSFAGLCESWPDPSKDKDDPHRWLWSAVVITTHATGPAGEIHDRTPLILPRERVDAWLDPHLTDPGKIADVPRGDGVSNDAGERWPAADPQDRGDFSYSLALEL
jgi:putative SOS response-associated peptidase YedK